MGELDPLAGAGVNTVWSPTTSPPRATEKPTVPLFLSPVAPWRAKTPSFASAPPRALAATSPSIRAVPDGASTFILWWISKTSAS